MSRSINFNGTDLADYGLVVTSASVNKRRQTAYHIQVQDLSYPVEPKRLPRDIRLDVAVTGTSRADLDDKLDNLKRILFHDDPKHLILDILDDRYFEAILENFAGDYKSATLFTGDIDFVCPDPDGYDVDQTTSESFAISGTTTVTETTEGTGDIRPVYTITAIGNLTSLTVLLKNMDTGEELSWGAGAGALSDGQKLEIDTVTWVVKKQTVANMATVSGQFPKLLASTDNRIKVTGISSGTLVVVYRNRYL